MSTPLPIEQYKIFSREKKHIESCLKELREKVIEFLKDGEYEGILYRQDDRIKLYDDKVIDWAVRQLPGLDIETISNRVVDYEKLDRILKNSGITTEDMPAECYTISKVDVVTVK